MEDENFYDHMGIDFASILRAFLANFTTGSIRQGASTITQQLARDMFLTLEQSMDRKVKEALLSFKIERTFSKDQILEMYLNKTYLGGGNYGVESAAQNILGNHQKILPLQNAHFWLGYHRRPLILIRDSTMMKWFEEVNLSLHRCTSWVI